VSTPVEQPKEIVAATVQGAPLIPSESEPERWAAFIAERERVAMSVPSMKMAVPKIPGYVSYWFNDDEGRIERAQRAGYEFASSEEVALHDFSVAGDSTKTGNQDMGSRVSMVVGTLKTGAPMRGYLMKIREEVWKVDQMLQQKRNDQIAHALRAGRLGTEEVSQADLANTYVRTAEVSRTDRRLAPLPGGKVII
jgi:hypothetical protein